MPTKKKEYKLEEAMKRLDEIVRALENTGADLEESLKLYEEGVGLIRQCSEKLDAADARVKAIRKTADGAYEEVPFTEETNTQ